MIHFFGASCRDQFNIASNGNTRPLMTKASQPFINLIPTPLWAATAAVLLLAAGACKKKPSSSEPATSSPSIPAAVTVAGLHQNNLNNGKSSFLTSQANSPIHWQTWGPHIFKHAEQERKTIFALIGSGTDADTLKVLDLLNQSPSTCALMNQQHVNVLIDSNCNPAMEYFAAALCLKSGTYVSRPLLIWFSYEGNPISWSTTGSSSNNVHELVSRMSKTVHRLWRDDPEYVLQNSRNDFKRRVDNLLPKPNDSEGTLLPASIIRQAASLYDPTSNNIDRTGRISAARYINLLAKASTSDKISDSQQIRYGGTARLAAQNVLIYGLTDPLDGGIYDGMQRTSSALPIFSKSLKTQALSMEALYNLYQLTEDEIYLTAANNIKAYTEQNLKLPNGDYLQGIIYAPKKATDNHCVWTLEQLEETLTEEELRVCKIAFGIRGLGNVPLVDDKNRAYFRKNTLTWRVTKKEVMEKTQLKHNELETLLESIAKKLSKIRTDRGPVTFKENTSAIRSLALYASSLVTAYRATGDDAHLQEARKIFDHIKTHFTDQAGKLHETKYNGKLLPNVAGATAYSLVCNAALDLYEVTSDSNYLDTAYKTHTQMNDILRNKENNTLYEQNYSNFPVDYKVTEFITIPNLNNFSSWAIAWSNANRLLLHKKDETLEKQKLALEKTFRNMVNIPPMVVVDYLTSYSHLNQPKVYMNGEVSKELLDTAVRRPCHIITMNGSSHPNLSEQVTNVPAGSAAVMYGGKLLGITNQASELRQWLK